MKEVFKKWWFWPSILIFSFMLIVIGLNSGVSLALTVNLIVVGYFIGLVYMLIKYRKQVIKKWLFWVLLGLIIFLLLVITLGFWTYTPHF